MKNYLSLCFLLISLWACTEQNSQKAAPPLTQKSTELPEKIEKKHIRIFVYDGCQYIILRDQQGSLRGYMSHKGNCNNPIHEYKITKDSL